MNFFGKLVNKMIDASVSEDSKTRLSGSEIMEKLNEPNRTEIVLTERECITFRKILSEKLGREFFDTPIPSFWNGVEILTKPLK